ncbi:hypothetical protein WI26_00020 [Burkholderia diffusa]|nr:hypothetical protein WI26_00020 [Burkholderia diffusa]
MEKLALPEMWDKKRKLLAFFEEMALLVSNKMIDANVADYMFSYYVKTAWNNEYFREGIDPAEEHWGLLFNYMKEAELRRKAVPSPAPHNMKL